MKALMIGEGPVSIGIGASLKGGGIEVDFLITENPKTCKLIRENGIKRSGKFREITVPAGAVGAFDAFEKLPQQAYDFILIASAVNKNEENAARLDFMRGCRKKDAPIIFLQEGLGCDEAFLPYFTEKNCYHSRILTDFEAVSEWESRIIMHQDDVLLGTCYRNILGKIAPVAEALYESGLPTSMDTEIEAAIWTQIIQSSVLGPISAVLGRNVGELAASEYSKNIIDILIEEAFAIMTAVGKSCEFETADDFRENLMKAAEKEMKDYCPLMLRDIVNKKCTNVESVTGMLLRLAGKYGVDCPVSTLLYWELKAIEEEL